MSCQVLFYGFLSISPGICSAIFYLKLIILPILVFWSTNLRPTHYMVSFFCVGFLLLSFIFLPRLIFATVVTFQDFCICFESGELNMSLLCLKQNTGSFHCVPRHGPLHPCIMISLMRNYRVPMSDHNECTGMFGCDIITTYARIMCAFGETIA